MGLRDLISRLWPGAANPPDSKKRHNEDAARLEDATQSHYRSVTKSDATGRSTKAGDPGGPPRRP